MPANLTPEYKAAEEEFRATKDPQGKLVCLEKMLSLIPKHKGTEKMQADLKRRISSLRESLEKKSGKRGFSIKVEKEGAAQVTLIGGPNCGKSTLTEASTNARTEAADYPFSTKSPVPAMFCFENIQFQLVDLPPVSSEHMEPWVTDIIRNADSALWLIDASDEQIAVQVSRVVEVLSQKKIEMVGWKDLPSTGHEPIRRIRTAVVATKRDLASSERGVIWIEKNFSAKMQVLPLSAFEDSGIRKLGKLLFELNRIIRVYSKTPGKEADLSKPFVMHQRDTLIDFARVVHKDFAEKLKFARVWGEGRFPGQRIPREQELSDGDVVELHM